MKAKRATCRKSKMMTISKKVKFCSLTSHAIVHNVGFNFVQVPCLSTREEFLSATLNVKSLQIGELYLQGYVETMVSDWHA